MVNKKDAGTACPHKGGLYIPSSEPVLWDLNPIIDLEYYPNRADDEHPGLWRTWLMGKQRQSEFCRAQMQNEREEQKLVSRQGGCFK